MVKPGEKIKLPSALVINKERLEAKLHPKSGTHFLLGVDQLYHTRDLKKKIFIKQNAKPSTPKILGKWIRLEKGYVFHYQKNKIYIAIFVQGYSKKSLVNIARVFVHGKSRVKKVSIYSMFISCVYAQEETVDPESSETLPQADTQAIDQSETAAEVNQNIAQCLVNRSASHVGNMATGAWNATQSAAGAVWNDPLGAAVNTWNFMYGVGESTVEGVYNSGAAVFNYCAQNCLNPNQIWNDTVSAMDKVYIIGQQLYHKAADMIDQFNELEPAVQSQLICEIGGMLIAEFGVGGVLGYLTGVGASAVTVRIVTFLNNLKNKVNNGMDMLRYLSYSNISTQDKQNLISSFMQGQKTEREVNLEIARLREQVVQGIANGRPNTPVSDAIPLRPPNYSIASALADQEISEVLESIPMQYRITTGEGVAKVKEEAVRDILRGYDFENFQYETADWADRVLHHSIKSDLLDREKVLSGMVPLIKEDIGQRWGNQARFLRYWSLLDERELREAIEDTIDTIEGPWDINSFQVELTRQIDFRLDYILEARSNKAGTLRDIRQIELENRWGAGVVRPGEEDDFAKWGISLREVRESDQQAEWERFNERLSTASEEDLIEIAQESEESYGLLSKVEPIFPDMPLISPNASTAAQASVAHNFRQNIPIKVSANTELGECSSCPTSINLWHLWRQNDHFDEHILDRAIQSSPIVENAIQYANGKTEVSTELVQAMSSLARADRSTSVWDSKTRNMVLQRISDIELRPLEVRSDTPNSRAFAGETDGYKFRVIVCERLPCAEGVQNIGDVISIYPLCGSTVLNVETRSKFESCFRNIEQCNKKKLVRRKPYPCKD